MAPSWLIRIAAHGGWCAKPAISIASTCCNGRWAGARPAKRSSIRTSSRAATPRPWCAATPPPQRERRSTNGVVLDLTGVDRDAHAATVATLAGLPAAAGGPRAEIRAEPRVRYVTADVFDLTSARRPDVVISALFAHHLDDAQLLRFLSWMEATARFGWLINDLHRHALAYRLARFLPRLLLMDRLVRHDAAVSVARSFTRRDWERLLGEVGLAQAPTTVHWRFPFRYAVGCIKA
jgi:hypothetical protein